MRTDPGLHAGRRRSGRLVWWWATAAAVIVVIASALVVQGFGRTDGSAAGQAAEQAVPVGPGLPVVERVEGPVPAPGSPASELEAGTAVAGPDGNDYGALPSSEDLPDNADPQLMAPDYVAVLDRDGASIAGYAKATELYATGGVGPEGATVYATDGTTIVGHFIPDKGFVPLTEDPSTVPTLLQPEATQ